MKTNAIRATGAALAAAAALSGCVVPEKFDISLTFQPDGAYHYTYSGTIVDAGALALTDGKLSASDNRELEGYAAKMAQKPGWKSVKYTGDARYKIEIERDHIPGAAVSVFDALTVRTSADGVTAVRGAGLSDKNRREMRELGIKPAGSITVKLPPGAEVINHNADSSPFLGRFGGYTWRFGSGVAAAPEILFRVPEFKPSQDAGKLNKSK